MTTFDTVDFNKLTVHAPDREGHMEFEMDGGYASETICEWLNKEEARRLRDFLNKYVD